MTTAISEATASAIVTTPMATATMTELSNKLEGIRILTMKGSFDEVR
jgi:hypothetical protein